MKECSDTKAFRVLTSVTQYHSVTLTIKPQFYSKLLIIF